MEKNQLKFEKSAEIEKKSAEFSWSAESSPACNKGCAVVSLAWHQFWEDSPPIE